MKVAHIGPPLARLGGPAGYLHALRSAAGGDAQGVLFPDQAASAPTPKKSVNPWRKRLGAIKRSIIPPTFPRLDISALRSRGGHMESRMKDLGAACAEAAAPSLAKALADDDVEALFTHDPMTAEVALRARPERKVWLFIHAPFPQALYHAWTFVMPEWPWEEFLSLPDVRAWIDWELAICQRVDRLVLPCAECVEEFLRVDSRFLQALNRAEYLLTGGAGLPFDSNKARETSRAQWRLPTVEPIGLFLGSAQPYRGLDCLLAALEKLPSRKDLPGLLAVAGPPKESIPKHPRLRALGRVTEVGDLLRAVDFVVNVNRFSLFDLSLIEACEAGKPLLLHATGGNKAFARLGAGCVMIKDLAKETIADGLGQMFTLTKPRMDELGVSSRACYDSHLSPERFWRRHQEFYCSPGAKTLASCA